MSGAMPTLAWADAPCIKPGQVHTATSHFGVRRLVVAFSFNPRSFAKDSSYRKLVWIKKAAGKLPHSKAMNDQPR